MKRIQWDTAILWGILIVIAVLLFLAAQTEKAGAQSWCPDGHQLVVDREGLYYLYSPNEPAGYSAIWVNDTVTLIPPIGQYGGPGDWIRVCYTDDIYAYAESIGRLPKPPQSPEPDLSCTDPQTGEAGLLGATGTCWTATLYDSVFSAENLATVPHQADPTRSVADVYGLTPEQDVESKPSTRTRTFTYPGGVTVYQSFVDIIKTAVAV